MALALVCRLGEQVLGLGLVVEARVGKVHILIGRADQGGVAGIGEPLATSSTSSARSVPASRACRNFTSLPKPRSQRNCRL